VDQCVFSGVAIEWSPAVDSLYETSGYA